MALPLHKKKKIVIEHQNILKNTISIVTADISGITVNELNKIRKKSKLTNVKLSVIKNTLLKKSLKNTIFTKFEKFIKGPTLIGFSMDHPGSASRLFLEFQKKNNHLKIKAGIFEKKILSILEISKLAKMPTFLEAIIKIIFILKEISLGKFLRILKSISKKK